MNKKAYLNVRVLDEIAAAVDLLCEKHKECSPTEVLNLCKFNHSKEMRTVVVEVASQHGYRVEGSGRGFKIFDW